MQETEVWVVEGVGVVGMVGIICFGSWWFVKIYVWQRLYGISELVINRKVFSKKWCWQPFFSPVFAHGDQHDQYLLVYLASCKTYHYILYQFDPNDQDRLLFCKAEWELIFSHKHLATVSHDSHIVWSLRSVSCTRCTKPLVDVYFQGQVFETQCCHTKGNLNKHKQQFRNYIHSLHEPMAFSCLFDVLFQRSFYCRSLPSTVAAHCQ